MFQTHILKTCYQLILAVILAFGADLTWAADSVPPDVASANKNWYTRPMNDSEFASSMCVLGATVGMAATYMVGPNEVIMLVVGGVVIPSSASVLFISLFSTMAAAGCTIGESSTPAMSWLYRHYGSN
ncbi:hypothetical protein TI04_02335 [Achromatium sp. WMS2]|nr:hypothetical protein TI04_02335 [Achromatium sp. WMS2]